MSRNYARFYVLLSRLPAPDRDELKAQLVSQFTGGRTESLRKMTDKEYDALCDELQRLDANRRARELYRAELRRRRSAALHLMQRLGIDTTDWNRVDTYCLHPRLAGKEFRKLTADELETLAIKLRIILRKENDKNNNNQLLN